MAVQTLKRHLEKKFGAKIDAVTVKGAKGLFCLDIFLYTKKPIKTEELITEVVSFYHEQGCGHSVEENHKIIGRIALNESLHGKKVAEVTIHNSTHTNLCHASITVEPGN